MKKVLIICDAFPPAFGPRMGYLCKYLKQCGWEPIVLTEHIDDTLFAFLADECPTTYVRYYTARGKVARQLEWLATFLLDLCFGYKDRLLYKKAQALIEEHGAELVLCSTFRTFPLPTALRIARKYRLPLIADTRDIIEQYAGQEYLDHAIPSLLGMGKIVAAIHKWKCLRQRNKALRYATAVTTISPWHVEVMKQYNPKVELIYNGFDPELFYPEQPTTRQFTITYTGRLISTAMRDPLLLLEALAILTAKGVLSPEKCRVAWYVDKTSEAVIRREADKAGVAQYMDFKGYVSASAIPKILNNSSVLLLLTNKAAGGGPKGIMTTKFFESLAVGKPILCVRSDEDCLEAAIRKTNAGLAARHADEVCNFLAHHYQQWQQQGYTSSSIRKEELCKYSRKEQANQFIRIFEQALRETSRA